MSEPLFQPGELEAIYERMSQRSRALMRFYERDSEYPLHPTITDAMKQRLIKEISEVVKELIYKNPQHTRMAESEESKRMRAIEDVAAWLTRREENPPAAGVTR